MSKPVQFALELVKCVLNMVSWRRRGGGA